MTAFPSSISQSVLLEVAFFGDDIPMKMEFFVAAHENPEQVVKLVGKLGKMNAISPYIATRNQAPTIQNRFARSGKGSA